LGYLGIDWEDNIKTDIRQIVWEVVYRTHLAQDRDQWGAVVSMVMNFLVS